MSSNTVSKFQRVNFGDSPQPLFEEVLEYNRDVPHSIRIKEFPTDEHVPLHYGNTMEILICDRLKGIITIEQYQYKLSENAVFVIPPTTTHSTFIKKCDGVMYILKIPFEALEQFINIKNIMAYENLDVNSLSYVCEYFDEMLELANKLIEDDNNIFCRMKHLLSIFEVLSRNSTRSANTNVSKKINEFDIKRLIKWTDENFANRINIEDVAKVAGYSKYYFCIKFKKITGMTYMNYLNLVRTSHAKLLLQQPGSITKIASRCGFEDTSYFSQLFKKYTGLTPQQYRKQFGQF